MVDDPSSPARPNLAIPIAAGLVAAVAGGIAWGLIVKWTQYEIGIAAWAIGLIVGFAVVNTAQGYRDRILQLFAVFAALLGVLIGKYSSYALWGEENGYSFREMWGWFDLLWVGLAVFTAWQATEPEARETADVDMSREDG